MNEPRKLTGHVVNPANGALTIEVHDQPGSGGANHLYKVFGYHDLENPSRPAHRQADTSTEILFQNGPIAEVGVNGLTQEVLVEIVIDRLRSFQAGPFACRENALALTKLEEAQMWLQKRTLDRMRRGVEGTHQK